ncbi:MAG TPA: glycoside hydrolase family 38 C-terminal domain-containing protein, partial [Thermomicrobiales bacterium]|nr:glycoside hydrolase family 38 C-terminal domain-containing protein [Thermomicrobiales bacterium]
MPVDRDDPHATRSATNYRHQLIDATAGVDVNAGPFTMRLSNVPLFRSNGDVLCQAVRVRIGKPVADATLVVRLRDGENVIDEQEAERAERPQSLFLLVPEVQDATRLTFQADVDGAVVGEVAFDVVPQRKWTIHLIHHSHYDIGYTDPQAEVMASQLAYIDGALELATVTDNWPDDARFRWNIEVNWPLREWLRTRPRQARDSLIQRIREGRIEVHALPFSMHTEAYSFDELARQLAFTAELREDYGIDIVTAMQTDVPGATIGLSTLLTDAGIRYLSVAHNYAGRSIPHLRDGQKLTRPFFWQAPDGDRLLVWYTDTLYGVAYMEGMTVGFGAGYDDVVSTLPEYLNALAQLPYPYGHTGDWLSGSLSGLQLTKEPYPHDILHLRVQGAFADNASASLLPAEIVREWQQQWAWPRLRMSLNRDFFADAEARLGDSIATFEGDWTDWWADGIGSAAVPLGVNRQAQNDIRTAQTLNALADVVTDEPRPEIAQEVESAYEDMALFDEHTWGAANPWERGAVGMASGEHQWTRKAAFAYTAAERVRTLLDGGLRRIASLGAVPGTQEDVATLLVVNPSSFARTDLVRVFLPDRGLTPESFELVDLASGETIPFIVEPQANASHRPRGAHVCFLARDVPAIGYARYGLRAGGPTSTSSPRADPTSGGTTTGIANEHLAVELDLPSSTIRSLVDRATGTELVAGDAPFGFNAYIYDRYASAPGFNHLSSRIGSAGPWLLGSRDTGRYGVVTARESNDVWERITVRASGAGADWIDTTLTLPHGVPRLHIENRLHKPVTMQKESVYFAFPFAIGDPEIAFEVTGGVVRDDSPRVPGSADHFRAIRQWVTLTGNGSRIAWATREAPLVQVGNIHLPYAPFPTTIPDNQAHPATIISWALNNIWDTNFPPQQGGEM